MATYSIVQAKDQLSRLIDEALAGTPVTITRHGKPAVHLMPAQPAPRPMTQADLDWLAERRATRPYVDIDAGTFFRAMRDEEPECRGSISTRPFSSASSSANGRPVSLSLG